MAEMMSPTTETADAGRQPIKTTPEQNSKARICKRLYSQAKERRERFERSGRETMRYGFSPDYNFEYQNTNPRAWYKAKYAKTAEAFGVMVPRLMPSGEPNRMITLPEPNPQLQMRTDARMYYLNYAPRFTRWAFHRRRATEEAVGYGRGVLWTGFDERTGMVASQWIPTEDVWDDPNALTCDDRSLIIRRRIMARYEAIDEYPKAEAAIRALPQHKKEVDTQRYQQVPQTDDTVCFIELWFLNGIGGYKGAEEIIKDIARANQQPMGDQQAKQLASKAGTVATKILIDENDNFLYECPWPISFNLMVRDPWPATFYDAIDNPQSIYPVGPLEAAAGIQRAMNHLVTLAMGKMKHCMKVMYAIKKNDRKGLSKEDVRRVMEGSDIEKIEVEFNGTTGKLSDVLEQFDWNMDWVLATQNFLAMLESLYERITGLYSFLHTGQGQTQDRSAQATQARERNTMARIDDMRDQFRECDAILASKECYAACTMLKPKDVAKILPQRLAQQWGILVRPEQMNPQSMIQMGIERGIMDPNDLMGFVQNMTAQAYTADEIIYQSLFEIEAAATRRKDIDQQIDMMKEKINTVVPVQIQSPDFNERAIGYETLALDAKLEGLPNDQTAYYKAQADMYRQVGGMQAQLQMLQLQQQLMMAQQQMAMMQAGVMPPQPGQEGQPQGEPATAEQNAPPQAQGAQA